MFSNFATEAELRRNVIDRLIAASLTDAKPAREANLQRWRSLKLAGIELPMPRETPIRSDI